MQRNVNKTKNSFNVIEHFRIKWECVNMIPFSNEILNAIIVIVKIHNYCMPNIHLFIGLYADK